MFFNLHNDGFRLRLANYMRVSPSCIYEWLNPDKKKHLPWKRCIQIERLSNGRISVEDLRPDLFDGLNTELPNPFNSGITGTNKTSCEIQGVQG